MTEDEFALAAPAVGRRRPARRIVVTVTDEAIAAAASGLAAERIIIEAVRAACPEARGVAVDLGSIRWTDAKTGRRVTFKTPRCVRDAILSLANGLPPQSFRFNLKVTSP